MTNLEVGAMGRCDAEEETGDREKLQDMVRKLKEMDKMLHSKDCPPPTVAEMRLYGLIMKHVRLYILLFQKEQSSQALRDQRMSILSSAVDDDPVGANFYDYIENVNVELCVVLGSFWYFLKFLEDCRNSLAEIYFPLGESVETVSWVKRKRRTSLRIARLVKGREEQSQGMHNGLQTKKRKIVSMTTGNQAKENETTREQCLFDILQGLEEMRKLHSYAPPVIEDVHYYREIRKLTTSFIKYVDAKVVWQRHFPEKAEGEEKWVKIQQCVYASPFIDSPPGYKAAAFFDELFELESLLKESSSSFAEIWCCLSEGNGMKDSSSSRNYDDNRRMYTVNVGRGEGKKAQGSQRSDMKRCMLGSRSIDAEMMLPTDCKPEVGMIGEVKKKPTRERYLQDIYRIVAKMKSLCLSIPLTTREIRLLSHINKHAYCSVWMYSTELDAAEFRNAEPEKYDFVVSDSINNDYDLSDSNANDGEMKTREQYLQEIVSLVEEIESSYLNTPPTAREARYYPDLVRQLSSLSLEAWIEKQGDVENEVKRDISMLKNLWKPVLEWELKWSKDVVEKCGQVMREMIIPLVEIDTPDPLKWVIDNSLKLRSGMMDKFEDIVSGSPQKLEILDQSLLALRKACFIANTIASELSSVNDDMVYCTKNNRNCICIRQEVSSIELNMLLGGETDC